MLNFFLCLLISLFMQTLLGFVNFKLYHSINVKYPPILDPRLEAIAAGKSFNDGAFSLIFSLIFNVCQTGVNHRIIFQCSIFSLTLRLSFYSLFDHSSLSINCICFMWRTVCFVPLYCCSTWNVICGSSTNYFWWRWATWAGEVRYTNWRIRA